MNKIKIFFQTLWGYIIYPYYWLTSKSVEKKFNKIIEENKKSLITEKDVEFLKSIGVETDLETLKNGEKSKPQK